MDPTWKHPFTATISGPSSCGKTQWTLRFIKHVNQMVSPNIDNILWCYGVYQDIFNEQKNIEFHDGLPNENMFDGKRKTLLIIDDLMSQADDRVENIFTRLSHHMNVSVLFLTQNLFFKSKQARTISLNSHYIVVFKNARDALQISNLARQMYPGNSKYMVEAFKDATSGPYGYLLIDMKPYTEEAYRLRTNIFPGETHYVYIRK